MKTLKYPFNQWWLKALFKTLTPFSREQQTLRHENKEMTSGTKKNP